jgi:hypothetical protein
VSRILSVRNEISELKILKSTVTGHEVYRGLELTESYLFILLTWGRLSSHFSFALIQRGGYYAAFSEIHLFASSS